MYKALAFTHRATAWEACLCVFLNYCMVFKRSQYVHNRIVRWRKHITYTSSSRALVLVQCGHGMAGVRFFVGLWVPYNWGLFCIPEGHPETPSDERGPSVQRWNRRPDQLCSNSSQCLNLLFPINNPQWQLEVPDQCYWPPLWKKGQGSGPCPLVVALLGCLENALWFSRQCCNNTLSLLTPLGRSPSALTVCPPSVCVCFHLR